MILAAAATGLKMTLPGAYIIEEELRAFGMCPLWLAAIGSRSSFSEADVVGRNRRRSAAEGTKMRSILASG